MNQIIKYLGRQRLKYKNVNEMKSRYYQMNSILSNYGIQTKVKNDFDFFCLEVVYTSFLNKRTFETTYESLRSEFYDAWEHLEHAERKNYVEIQLKPKKEEMKYFLNENNKIIRIAFFDELLNSLYENEMVIFERPQYFHLEADFKKRMTSIFAYRDKSFEANFSSCTFVNHNEDGFVLFSNETKCLYYYDYKDCYVFPLNEKKKSFDLMDLFDCSISILEKSELELGKKLIEKEFVNDRVKKRIMKYLRKNAYGNI